MNFRLKSAGHPTPTHLAVEDIICRGGRLKVEHPLFPSSTTVVPCLFLFAYPHAEIENLRTLFGILKAFYLKLQSNVKNVYLYITYPLGYTYPRFGTTALEQKKFLPENNMKEKYYLLFFGFLFILMEMLYMFSLAILESVFKVSLVSQRLGLYL